MVKIEKINSLCKGKYLELKEVFFELDGVKKRWEVCNSLNSVAILIYDVDLDSIILVKQFRMPLYLKNSNGYAYELCAGLCDKDKPNITIAKEEILEECGYDVDESKIEFITSTWGSVGNQASKQDVFYVEVNQKEKVSSGGGIDDEKIEVIELKREKVEEFIFSDVALTPGAKFALMWWIHYKAKN